MLFCTLWSAGTNSRLRPITAKKRLKKPKKKGQDASQLWSGCPDLLMVPKEWFLGPLRQSLQTLVRPCTRLTRRKQLSVKVQLPLRCFMEFMSPLLEGSVEGLERDSVGRLVPTKETAAMKKYQYVVRKGSQLDKLFGLQHFEKRHGKASARWRRSLGCARLYLSRVAEARGQIASVMAMVCGNVVIDYREPRGLKSMPRLTVRMFVLSMDRQGHIVWPIDFEVRTKAALRKQARALLSVMLDDPKTYPVDSSWKPALTQASDSRLELQPRRPSSGGPANAAHPQARSSLDDAN